MRLDIPWRVFVRVVETGQFFLFFYNSQCAYYVPKRVLDAQQIGMVREVAREALGDRVRLMPGSSRYCSAGESGAIALESTAPELHRRRDRDMRIVVGLPGW